jgi:hypothetical protein
LGGPKGEFDIGRDQMQGSLLFQIWLDQPKAPNNSESDS